MTDRSLLERAALIIIEEHERKAETQRNAQLYAQTATNRQQGCICPAGAERACQGWSCPRKGGPLQFSTGAQQQAYADYIAMRTASRDLIEMYGSPALKAEAERAWPSDLPYSRA